MLEHTRMHMLEKLATLRNSAMSPGERARLVADIEWKNMPYEQRAEIEALRQHMRQFNTVSTS